MQKGFTLLELIIVIIIVGVLASLALPRFFSMVEFARSAEAMSSLMTVRQSILRCGQYNNNYMGCDTFADIDIDDPGSEPGAHFSYAWTVTSADAFTVTATRNTINGGSAGDTVVVSVAPAGISRSGTSAFAGIK